MPKVLIGPDAHNGRRSGLSNDGSAYSTIEW